MRLIRKEKEPRCLLEHRAQAGADYDGLPGGCKDEVRTTLAREQRYLCAYCMQRIRPERERMKVEHRVPQSTPEGSARRLDWQNLLGVCRGNEGSSPREQHCDTRKGGRRIRLDPLDRRCEGLLRYDGNGRMVSDDPEIQLEIDEALNLNVAYLQRNRRSTLEAFLDQRVRQRSGAWSSEWLEKWLEELERPDAHGQLRECVQVLIYWIRKRLGRPVH